MKACVFDIDDTLLDFVSHLCTIHNNIHGTEYSVEDLTEWKLPEPLRETFAEYENWIYTSLPIFPKVIKKIHDLRIANYKIILMTARDVEFKKHTIFNLALNGIKYDELHFNKNKSLKINRLSEKYDIHVFADDKLDTVNKVKRDTEYLMFI